jgi:FeS assembly SUF system protein
MRDDAVETPTPEAPQPQEAPASSAAAGAAVPAALNGAAVSDDLARLTDEIVTAIKTVYDPEIPADVYELGLIYKIDIGDDRAVHVDMTLTTPNCPSAQELPTMVENAVASVPGVGIVNVNLVWEPAWTPDRMTDEARLVLNMW